MYIFKNAMKSILRSKGRNVLIGIIVLVIAIASCVALTIRNSADEIVQKQRDNLNITATLGIDRNALRTASQSGNTNMRDLMSSIPALTVSNLNSYADSPYVKNLSYSQTISMNSSDMTAVSNSTSSNQPSKNFGRQSPGGVSGRPSQGDFRVIGYNATSAMTNFVNGTYQMTSGSMFTDGTTGNVAVITDELAQANNLQIGSPIHLTNPNDAAQTYDFTVAGIYTDTSSNDGAQMNFYSNAANQIITDDSAVNRIVTASQAQDASKINAQLNSSFTLKNANDVSAFTAELKTKGLSKYYTVLTNVDNFSNQVEPLSNLIHFTTFFLIIVLIIGSVVLVVLHMINIRERKYEVGVLRAIGMKKGKVALQYVIELFIVTFIALTIGSGIGAVSSIPTANYMLQHEISSLQSSQAQVQQNFGRSTGTPTQNRRGSGLMRGTNGFFGIAQNTSYINEINAVTNGRVLLEIAGIGLLLAMMSSGISLIFISRYEPLKILSNLS